MITHGNKASLYHEATGVPEGVPQKKTLTTTGQFQNSYQLIQMSSFQFSSCFGGPTLSQHITSRQFRQLRGLLRDNVACPLPTLLSASTVERGKVHQRLSCLHWVSKKKSTSHIKPSIWMLNSCLISDKSLAVKQFWCHCGRLRDKVCICACMKAGAGPNAPLLLTHLQIILTFARCTDRQCDCLMWLSESLEV